MSVHNLDNSITALSVMRAKIEDVEDYWQESEILYQTISLCMGINEALKHGEFDKKQEYICEKAAILSSLIIDYTVGELK